MPKRYLKTYFWKEDISNDSNVMVYLEGKLDITSYYWKVQRWPSSKERTLRISKNEPNMVIVDNRIEWKRRLKRYKDSLYKDLK